METSSPENNKRKLQQTILDTFTKLTYNQQNVRVKSGIALIKHLFEKKADVQNVRLCLCVNLKITLHF